MNTINPSNPSDNLISNAYAYKNQKTAAKAAVKADGHGMEAKISDKVDKVEKNPEIAIKKSSGVPETEGVYTKKTAHNEKAEGISAQINLLRQQSAESLVQMIYDVLSMEGRHRGATWAKLEDAVMSLKEQISSGALEVTPEEQAAAAAAIGDDGPWGVEAVSDRLVAMAVKLSGGDESKFKMMRSAIEAGFKMAEAMWGGELPEISYKTFEATMTKLAAAFGQNRHEASEASQAAESQPS